MDKQSAAEAINIYYKSVCEAYRLGNVESSYNAPIITLLTKFECAARDLSGERRGQTGENIDIKLWHSEEEVTETEPFAGVEVKKVGGIDSRARVQIKTEAVRYGNAILTDNLEWEFWHANEVKMYAGLRLAEVVDGRLALKKENIELFISLVEDSCFVPPRKLSHQPNWQNIWQCTPARFVVLFLASSKITGAVNRLSMRAKSGCLCSWNCMDSTEELNPTFVHR